ncbi:MAG: helix-turn-helix domain-containing protein [Candidatus Bathyarchaeota archaeon]|nr:helix-turn-helix domain-containing protein [Candidatus Bathyarchaeota archaeon]
MNRPLSEYQAKMCLALFSPYWHYVTIAKGVFGSVRRVPCKIVIYDLSLLVHVYSLMLMKDIWRQPYHVVLEVENRQCAIVKKCAAMGLTSLKVVDVRSSHPGSVKHLVELDPTGVKKIKNETAELKSIPSKNKGKASIWLESEGCGVCNAILSSEAFLVSGKSIENFTIVYSFLVPNFGSYKKIISALEAMELKVKILKMGRFESHAGVLTEKQEKIFWLALKSGFFDYPRKIDTVELAKRLGISPSTLSEITRRGTRRLLEYYFKGQP